MEWVIKDLKKIKNKYPNTYALVNKHKHFFQVGSSYGDLSGMFKHRKDAIAYAKKHNKTKTFSIKNYEW